MQPEVIVGDCRSILPTLPAESVHTVVTSPPFWSLRDYKTVPWQEGDSECDHRIARSEALEPAEALASDTAPIRVYRRECACGAHRVDQEIGLEESPDAHAEALVEVFREVKRVLRADGCLWLNYGDAYASSWPCQRRNVIGNGSLENGKREARPPRLGGDLKEKDLIGLPWTVAFALRADGWYLRSAITLCKNNPMPESVTDRPTQATEMLFLLTKRASYFYDAAAIAETSVHPEGSNRGGSLTRDGDDPFVSANAHRGQVWVSNGRRNKRNWWVLNSQPLADAHFATFPEKLVEPCILAGTSEWGCCAGCGAPWKRVVEKEQFDRRNDRLYGGTLGHNPSGKVPQSNTRGMPDPQPRTTGWVKTCSCETDDVEPCVCLDPFGGSGTVGKVATKLGRRSILIELNESYVDIIRKRNAQLGLGV